jgi:Domain of Unknown Function (DUF1206)
MGTHVENAAESVTGSPWFERAARMGYVARGVIYILIGILAVQLAGGGGGEDASQDGAMRAVADQTFGRTLLVILAVGLAGYALWRATMAFVGRTPEAGRHSGLDRLGAAASAVAYGFFCVLAISILTGSGQSGGSGGPRKATSDVFGWPAGRALVALAAIIFIGVGAYQVYLALSRRFLKDSKTMYLSPTALRGFTAVGVIGLCARGVTFGLIGTFLLKAAIEFDAKEAVGLDGALQRLSDQTYGAVLLGIVAVGLVAFGIYSIVDARVRKI